MNTGYILCSVIVLLFVVGISSIIYSIIFEMPVYYNIEKKTEKEEQITIKTELFEDIEIDDDLLEE